MTADENVQLYHNVDKPILLDPWSLIIKGTSGSNRIGDRITNRGIKYKFFLTNKWDRPNLSYRVTIGTIPQAVNGNLVTQANLINFLWRQTDFGTLGNTLVLTHNKEYGVRIIYDKTFSNKLGNVIAGASAQGKEHHLVKKYWLRPKRGGMIQYMDNQTQTRGRWLFATVTPYDSWGTFTTDNVASMAYSCHMYFKDF